MCSERRWLLSIVLTIAMSVTMLFNPAWMMVSYADSEDIVVLDEGTTEDGFVYDYVNSDGEKMIRITGYTGDSDVLDVPAEIGDYPVKAFIISGTDDDSYANITEIHFPETMLYVDTDGLDSFSGLESISGPDGEDFDNTAYKTADGVLYRHLKNGFSVAYYPRASEMTEWDMDPDTHALYAEVSNPNLEVINMPAALHAMDLEVLRGFSSLEAVNVDSDNLDYSSEDGVLYSKDFGTLYFYPAAKPGDAYTVNSNTTDIHWSAFFAGHLCETITLPEGIRTADSECFGNDPDKCAVRTIVFTSEKAPKDFSRFRGVREAVEYLGADIEFPENGTGYEEFREGLSSGGFVTPPEDCPELTIGEEVEGETEDGSEIVTYKITTPEPVTEDDENGEDNWEQYMLTVTRFGTGATAGGEMRACIFEAGAEYDQLNTESNGSTLTDETELKLGKEYYLQIDTGAGCGYKVLLSKYQSSNDEFPGIPEDCEEIGLDEEKTAAIIKDNDVVTYAFTPASDGVYYFSAQGSYDTLGRVITASEEADQGFEQVGYDDDSNGMNFSARFEAKAGTTYYLQARMCDSRGTGRFPVKVTKGIDFADVPENCDDAPLKRDVPINFSDGTETITYRFKAPATTDYRIRSTGRLNLNMRLIRDGEVVPYANEYDESSNFWCNLEAESGEVYYIQIISALGETGSSSFIIEFNPEFSDPSPEDKLIEEGVTETVEDAAPYDTESFRFIPETTGEYTISTEGCSGKDLRVEYYDEENDEQYGAGWSYSEDTEGGDFFRNYYLEEGKEYHIQVLDISGEVSTYDLNVVKVDDYYLYSEPEEDAEEISDGDVKTVNIDTRNKTVTYSFTPSLTNEYTFESIGDCNTKGRVLNTDGEVLADQSWGGPESNFSLKFGGEKGKKYLLQTRLENIGIDSYKVALEAKPDFDDVDINSGDIEKLQLNESKTVGITEPGGNAAFQFSPEEAGTYMFISTGEKDTAGRLVYEYDGGEWNDDYNGSKNFALQFYADPEGVYTLQAGLKAGDTGSFNVKVVKADGSYDEPDPNAEYIDIDGIYGPAFEDPFETVTYRFTAKKNSQHYFELYGTDKADLRVIDPRVIDPYESTLTETRVTGGEYTYLYIPESGTYYLQLRRINGETGRLKFRVHRSTSYEFDQVPDDCETISAGETKTAKIDQLDKTVTYEFVPVESGQYEFCSPASSHSIGRVIDGAKIHYNSVEEAEDYFCINFYGKAGQTYFLQIRPDRKEYGSIPVTLRRAESININTTSSEGRIEYIWQHEFVYDGEEHKPSITVKYDGKTLEEGTDYTVSYPEESVACDEYSTKITFIGAFSGEHWIDYWIECYHNYDDGVITKDPTCTDIGSLEFTCSVCGDTFTRDIDPLGHAWDEGVITTPATETESGVKTFTCTRDDCGKTKTLVIPALGDVYGEPSYEWAQIGGKWVCEASRTAKADPEDIEPETETVVAVSRVITEPTCQESGQTRYTAIFENPAFMTQIRTLDEPAADSELHSWGPWETVSEPTCAAEGEVSRTCSVCGETETETVEKLTTHEWGEPEITKEATCAEFGEKVYTCEICGTTKTLNIAKTKDHKWGEPETLSEPDCANRGVQLVTCTVCGAEEERYTPRNSDDHTWGSWEEYDADQHSRTCLINENHVEYADHTWDDGVVTKEASANEDGIKTYTCSVCGAERTETIPRTHKHTAGETQIENEVAGTCVSKGSYDEVTYCTDCGEVISRKHRITETDPYNHADPGEPVQEEGGSESTCTEPGWYYEVVSCNACGEVISRDWKESEALGHDPADPVKENIVPSTETEEGSYDVVVYCSRCNEELSRETHTTDASGHTHIEGAEVEENRVEPNCHATGHYDICVYCTECNELLSRDVVTLEIDPDNHDGGTRTQQENYENATCGTDGSYDTVTYCKGCGEELSRETTTIEATGDHYWDDGEVTTEATCIASGVITYTCYNCGQQYTEEYDLDTEDFDSHDWDEGTVTKTPTCSKEGVRTYICSLCGREWAEPIDIDPEAHNWDAGKVTTEPTCAEEGVKTFTCTVCGKTRTEAVPATGKHTWDEGKITTEPTCAKEGVKTFTCSVCGETKTEEIPATGEHTWDEGKVTTEPTCAEKGVKTFTCSVCGETKTEEIPATGIHTWDEGKVTTEPTCAEEGVKTFTCTVCGKTRTEAVPATGEHTWDEGKITTEPTCAKEGVKTFTCSVCGKTRTEAVPATGEHTWDEGKVTTEPTCVKEGVKTFTCSVCGETRTEAVSATGVHTWDEGKITTAPTCKTEGVKTFTCSVCGETKTESVAVDPDAHKWGAWKVTEPATYENAGSRERTCELCGEKQTEVIPVLVRQSIEEAEVSGLSAKTYTGKALTPKPVVVLNDVTLAEGTDYTVEYSSNKDVGTASVVITGTGAYKDSVTAKFDINPKANKLSKVVPAKKAMTVKWKKMATKMSKSTITGYQIQYSLKKNFKSGNKVKNVKGFKKVSLKIKKLKSKKTYYVRMRTYMKVGSKTYYSTWSNVKKAKIK